jgi:hypothetical protein
MEKERALVFSEEKQIKKIIKEMVRGFFFYLSTKPLVNQIKPPVHLKITSGSPKPLLF